MGKFDNDPYRNFRPSSFGIPLPDCVSPEEDKYIDNFNNSMRNLRDPNRQHVQKQFYSNQAQKEIERLKRDLNRIAAETVMLYQQISDKDKTIARLKDKLKKFNLITSKDNDD